MVLHGLLAETFSPDSKPSSTLYSQRKDMTTSLFQDAQSRSLANLLAGIQQREELLGHNHPLSPPLSTSSSGQPDMYSGLEHAAASSNLNILSPTELLAVNRHAVAFMANLPMAPFASTLFSHPAALFSSWASTGNAGINLENAVPHSPPTSPLSPLNINSSTQLNKNVHPLSSPTEVPPKKPRKSSMKKDLSPGLQISMNISDLYHTPGPPSPPSSGSSPNTSTHEVLSPSTSTSSGNNHNNSKDLSARDKSFTCKICFRAFGYKHVLQNHERTHTGEKPFECPDCHKRFTRDHHLKTHMRLHTGEKPYHCSHCDRHFVQVANLRRHLRVHTGEKPYTCEICEGKFSDSNQLKSHMLVHNQDKPFECERCHSKFRRRHHLQNHKCGVQSLITPDLSPALGSDHLNCEHRSVYSSEESVDIAKSLMDQNRLNYNNTISTEDDAPLDLSEDVGCHSDETGSQRSRKANEIRRVFRLPPQQIMHIASDLPEQTEPEDLSVHNKYRREQSPSSPSSASQSPGSSSATLDDLDSDELDDAAITHLRQRHKQHSLSLNYQPLQVE